VDAAPVGGPPQRGGGVPVHLAPDLVVLAEPLALAALLGLGVVAVVAGDADVEEAGGLRHGQEGQLSGELGPAALVTDDEGPVLVLARRLGASGAVERPVALAR